MIASKTDVSSNPPTTERVKRARAPRPKRRLQNLYGPSIGRAKGTQPGSASIRGDDTVGFCWKNAPLSRFKRGRHCHALPVPRHVRSQALTSTNLLRGRYGAQRPSQAGLKAVEPDHGPKAKSKPILAAALGARAKQQTRPPPRWVGSLVHFSSITHHAILLQPIVAIFRPDEATSRSRRFRQAAPFSPHPMTCSKLEPT